MAELCESQDRTGVVRRFGNVRPDRGLLRAWPLLGAVPRTRLYSPAEWPNYIRPDPLNNSFLPYIHDQGAIGQCNAEATVTAIESARAVQGLDRVVLSPGDLYDQINGGVDEGSTLERGIIAAMTGGVGLAATTGGVLWHPGWKPAPAAERARYKVLEAYLCPTYAHQVSAVIDGFFIISGMLWYPNYFAPDGDGWLGYPVGSPVGGHAMMGYAIVQRSGLIGIMHRQSWGPSFGLGGNVVVPEYVFAQGMIGGAWAVRLVTDEGGVIPGIG